MQTAHDCFNSLTWNFLEDAGNLYLNLRYVEVRPKMTQFLERPLFHLLPDTDEFFSGESFLVCLFFEGITLQRYARILFIVSLLCLGPKSFPQAANKNHVSRLLTPVNTLKETVGSIPGQHAGFQLFIFGPWGYLLLF